jgi:transcriptional regulator with XRE-family HTH domain
MDDKWFKQQQKRAGVTADQIADVLGRDRSVVSKILSGKQRMSLEWAQAFADTLDVPIATVLEKSGAAPKSSAVQVTPGFAEGDAAAFTPAAPEGGKFRSIAAALGADRAGIDIWRVRSSALALAGYLTGDFFLLDTHQAERCRAGDVVIAQIYQRNGTASTVLRRYEPPVLVAASADASDMRVHVVDGDNVVIRGKVIASWRLT